MTNDTRFKIQNLGVLMQMLYMIHAMIIHSKLQTALENYVYLLGDFFVTAHFDLRKP